MAKAYVMMNCDLGSEKEVISGLKKITGVKEAHGTFGLYDIIAQIESDSEDGIQDIVTKSIRKIPKIHSTVTLTRSESEELFRPSEKLIGLMLADIWPCHRAAGRSPVRAHPAWPALPGKGTVPPG